MPRFIGLDEMEDLLATSAQVVEVLPESQYQEKHLPGAMNIDLEDFSDESLSRLEKDKPVVVYCWDFQ
ncbi:MAG: rhodanese-like domain-containing protein [Actinobacteria bacterium]|nr:rhodanese-like domain-containing protein [Actinomycetota bacterium]